MVADGRLPAGRRAGMGPSRHPATGSPSRGRSSRSPSCVAALTSRRTVTDAGSGVESYAWVGFAVIVAQAAAIVAAGLAADGLRAYMESGSFGWRQPLAAGRGRDRGRDTGRRRSSGGSVDAPHGQLERSHRHDAAGVPLRHARSRMPSSASWCSPATRARSTTRCLPTTGCGWATTVSARSSGRPSSMRAIADALSASPATAVSDAGRLRHRVRDDAEPGRLRAWSRRSTRCRASPGPRPNVNQVVGWQVDYPAGLRPAARRSRRPRRCRGAAVRSGKVSADHRTRAATSGSCGSRCRRTAASRPSLDGADR